jgi:hypothetical protein
MELDRGEHFVVDTLLVNILMRILTVAVAAHYYQDNRYNQTEGMTPLMAGSDKGAGCTWLLSLLFFDVLTYKLNVICFFVR